MWPVVWPAIVELKTDLQLHPLETFSRSQWNSQKLPNAIWNLPRSTWNLRPTSLPWALNSDLQLHPQLRLVESVQLKLSCGSPTVECVFMLHCIEVNKYGKFRSKWGWPSYVHQRSAKCNQLTLVQVKHGGELSRHTALMDCHAAQQIITSISAYSSTFTEAYWLYHGLMCI